MRGIGFIVSLIVAAAVTVGFILRRGAAGADPPD